ncbi:MAG: Tol-Pal system protein TolB [Sulfurimonadaceae bacterium]|jgi:TolB protein
MRIIFGVLFSALLLWGSDATIEVRKSVDALPTIAVEDASSDYQDGLSKRFFRVMVSDLNVLSIFNVDRDYVKASFSDENVADVHKEIDYVVRYQLVDNNGVMVVNVNLINNDKVMHKLNYRIKNPKQYVFLVHTIAASINDFMGADPVDWMKEKVIISRTTGPRRSEIMITDYTLSYQFSIKRSGLNVFPKWADRTKKYFYYTNLTNGTPELRKHGVYDKSDELVLTSDGMLICSDVSADGKKLLLSMAPDGQPDVYEYDVTSKKVKKVTKYSGIDVNAQYMADGKIAFISNRLGYPNVFSKKTTSQATEQMVYVGKSNSACTAHGNYIIYKARESSNAFSKNTFNLHLISTKTDFIRRLTVTGINENPLFSRDGDTVLFVKKYKNQSSIGVIRLNQNKNYLFPLKGGAIQSIDW